MLSGDIPPRFSAFPERTLKVTSPHLVVIPLYHVHVRRDSPQILVGLSIAYISRAEYLLDLPRYEQFLEFAGEVVDAVWNVQVADNENENHPEVVVETERVEITSRVAMEVAFGRLRNLSKTLIRSPSALPSSSTPPQRHASGKGQQARSLSLALVTIIPQGKSNRGRRRGGRTRDGGDEYRSAPIDKSTMNNASFELYYKTQAIVPEDQWDAFLDSLREPLPTTFRVAGSRQLRPSSLDSNFHR